MTIKNKTMTLYPNLIIDALRTVRYPGTGKDLVEMGMINAVVPFDKLEETTVEWCRTIMKRSPMAIRMIKRALNAELDGQRGLMELAGDATLMYYLMDEAQEGKNAFLEKRDPDFEQFPKFPG